MGRVGWEGWGGKGRVGKVGTICELGWTVGVGWWSVVCRRGSVVVVSRHCSMVVAGGSLQRRVGGSAGRMGWWVGRLVCQLVGLAGGRAGGWLGGHIRGWASGSASGLVGASEGGCVAMRVHVCLCRYGVSE